MKNFTELTLIIIIAPRQEMFFRAKLLRQGVTPRDAGLSVYDSTLVFSSLAGAVLDFHEKRSALPKMLK